MAVIGPGVGFGSGLSAGLSEMTMIAGAGGGDISVKTMMAVGGGLAGEVAALTIDRRKFRRFFVNR